MVARGLLWGLLISTAGGPGAASASPSPAPAHDAAAAFRSPPGAILFGTILDSLAEPQFISRDRLAPEVLARVAEFASRAAAFRSRQAEIFAPPGPESWLLEKRRHLERDLIACGTGEGPGEEAAAYARTATLAYEWEGMSEGPLSEAAFAEEYLRVHPGTPLASYLGLFLAHRYRCAHEILAGTPDAAAREGARARYAFHLERALMDADPLARFVAADLRARPFLYLADAGEAPGGTRPQALRDAHGAARFPAPGLALSLEQALDLADEYLKAGGIDLAGQFLHAVVLRYDETARDSYWHLQWKWSEPRLGGEFGLRVYMDGTIVQAWLGP